MEELARKLSSEEGRGVAVLGLDGNPGIGDLGAEALGKALATNATLTGAPYSRLSLGAGLALFAVVVCGE